MKKVGLVILACFLCLNAVSGVCMEDNNSANTYADTSIVPQRIVVLPLFAEEMLLDMIGPNRIVGVGHAYHENGESHSPTMALTKDIKGGLSIDDTEGILGLQPDLVILYAGNYSHYEALLPALEEASIPFLFVDEPEDFEDVKTTLLMLGDAVCAAKRSATMVRQLEISLAQLERLVASIPEEHRVHTAHYSDMLPIDYLAAPYMAMGSAAGVKVIGVARNTAQLAEWDPDLITVVPVSYDSDGTIYDISSEYSEEMIARLLEESSLSGVKAVKGGRISPLGVHSSQYMVQSAWELAEISYPQLFVEAGDEESSTSSPTIPISATEQQEGVAFYPGDLRKDDVGILARTRFDPICNAMITTSGEYEYGYYNVLGGILITKYTGTSTVVHIPEMIDGMPVRGIGVGLGRDIQAEYYETDELYEDCYDYPFGVFNRPDCSLYSSGGYSPFAYSNIVEVHIPEGVVSIGDGAFVGCSDLTNISLPNSVRYIGWGAFESCTGLTSIVIPDNVIEIGGYAFEGCTKLVNVTLPKSMQHIWYGAFKNCSSLKSVTIPEGIMTIESFTFSGCTGLTSIIIPDSVTRVDGDHDDSGGERWGAFEGIPHFSAVYKGKTYTDRFELYNVINGK